MDFFHFALSDWAIHFAWKQIETCFDRLVEMVLPELRSFMNSIKSHKIGGLPGSFRAAY